MYELTLESKEGYKLEFNQIGSDYKIISMDGLSPADATINTNENALIDGVTYNSSKVNARTISIGFSIENDPETSRLWAYRVIRTKEYIKMSYKSERLDVYVEGYVQSFKLNHTDIKQTATVTILCPFPYFKEAQQIINELTAIEPRFHFPFHSAENDPIIFGQIVSLPNEYITNEGAIETGLTFSIYARQVCSGLRIYNYGTGEYLGIDFTFEPGDTVVIKTGSGEKTIQLIRGGERFNIFNTFDRTGVWLQLPAGGATFAYVVEEGSIQNLEVTITHSVLYEGV